MLVRIIHPHAMRPWTGRLIELSTGDRGCFLSPCAHVIPSTVNPQRPVYGQHPSLRRAGTSGKSSRLMQDFSIVTSGPLRHPLTRFCWLLGLTCDNIGQINLIKHPNHKLNTHHTFLPHLV